MADLTDKFIKNHTLTKEEYISLLLMEADESVRSRLCQEAVRLRRAYYGNKIYTRGLIEFTNYCRNNCKYCGIRNGNRSADRYRLTKEEIMACCHAGYELGYRTFVLQGGEDPYFTDDRMVDIVASIRRSYPDCAITLSIGEKSRESYRSLKEAGADRYLLRHETASHALYEKLHPKEMSLDNRMRCLSDLKDLGYQVGAGFMVGAPGQTVDDLAEDLKYLEKLKPHMIGIGPFIPHHDTEYANESAGSASMTLYLLAILRIMFPYVLLPATTALGTLDPRGREKGFMAGANVVMPNLSPTSNRRKYELYDNKICTGDEDAESIACLQRRAEAAGCILVSERGDVAEAKKR